MALKLVTDEQLIEAVERLGSNRKAAVELGINARTIDRRMQRLVSRGHSPKHDMTHTVPEPFFVKGVSSYYNRDGKLTGQWVKSSVDQQALEAQIHAACVAMASEMPQLPPRKAVGSWRDDLLAVYPLGDPHVGMYSWAAETGEDWDLAIAERVHREAMRELVHAAPACKRAVVLNLGDLLHYDSMESKTPRSGHFVDADGRAPKMIDVAIKVMRQCIESALEKHELVHVINVAGNHDEIGARWLAVSLSHIYEKEPRVTIDTSPGLFNYYRFGNVFLGAHHGHTCKAEKLPGVMACDRAKDWGETTHRYWLTGHVHHESKKEYAGCTVESFNTLASKDAYAANGGWRSERSMQAVIYHAKHGEVARSKVYAEMFEEAA